MSEGNLEKIGINTPRFDSFEKVTGEAIYVDDIKLEGMLYGAVLRSPFPHALISRIDKRKAERIPGVAAVLTHEDIPGSNRIGNIIKDQPVLCDTRVRYVGDPVALVAGISKEVCEEALGAIEVYYEEIPPILTPEEALEPEALLIHEKGNIVRELKIIRGDVDRAISDGNIVIRNMYTTPYVEHACLEPEGGVGFIDETGRFIIYKPTQHLHYDYQEVASVLGIDTSKVSIRQLYMGGGFGSKSDASISCFVALLVNKTKKPVKMVLSREEVFIGKTKRHPFYIDYTTVASRDRKLKGVKVEIIANSGAYASFSPGVIQCGVVYGTGPYEVPNIEIRGRAVYTNNPVSGAMRGYGAPQVAFACEIQMDMMAKELGMDPIDFRLLNCFKDGSISPTGQILSGSVSIEDTLTEAKDYIKKCSNAPVTDKNKRRGWGVGCMFFGVGRPFPNPARAQIRLDDDGFLSLFISTVEMGTGVSTIMRQIAAEELGVNTEDIRFCPGDTDYSPDSGTATANRVTYIVGNAVKDAAGKLKDIIRETAAKTWKVDVESTSINGREVRWRDSSGKKEKTMPLKDIYHLSKKTGLEAASDGYFNPEVTPLSETGQGIPYTAYVYATHVAEIDVDTETGRVDVLRIIASHDVGKAINPQQVEGQIEGGVSMGIGYALSENLIVHNGSIVNRNFTNYLIPTAPDISEINPIVVESPEITGPFGAKGIGEPTTVPTAPAIVNAIYNATGVRIFNLPAIPENVFNLLKSR